jgi:hypothetical protein
MPTGAEVFCLPKRPKRLGGTQLVPVACFPMAVAQQQSCTLRVELCLHAPSHLCGASDRRLFYVSFISHGTGIALSVLWPGFGLDTWFDVPQGPHILLCPTGCKVAHGPTRPPTEWVPLALFPGLKWLWSKADRSLHLVRRLRMTGAILPLRHTPLWHEQVQ